MKAPIKQAQPLTPQIMLDMVEVLDLDVPEDAVFWAALLIGFFAMLCKGNLVPNHHSRVQPQ